MTGPMRAEDGRHFGSDRSRTQAGARGRLEDKDVRRETRDTKQQSSLGYTVGNQGRREITERKDGEEKSLVGSAKNARDHSMICNTPRGAWRQRKQILQLQQRR